VNDLQALIIYVTNHPDCPFEVMRMNYSGGVMTLISVGPYHIRWDKVCTSAFRKHWQNDNTEGMRKLFVKHLHDRDLGDIQIR
jgi:hypothetical protein